MPALGDVTYSSGNIITGSAYLFQGAVGAALPAISDTDNSVPDMVAAIEALAGTPWKGLGYTDAGIKFAYDPTYKDITVDEAMSPIDSLMTAEKLLVSCSLAEVTLWNMQRIISTAAAPTLTAAVVGPPATPSLVTLQHGGQQVTNKFALLMVGMAPGGFIRLINIYRTVATSKIDMSYKRGEKIMVPCEFTAQALTTNNPGNQLFQIVDKTGA